MVLDSGVSLHQITNSWQVFYFTSSSKQKLWENNIRICRFDYFENFLLKSILSSGWECSSVADVYLTCRRPWVLFSALQKIQYFHKINITKEYFAFQIKRTFKKVFNMVFALFCFTLKRNSKTSNFVSNTDLDVIEEKVIFQQGKTLPMWSTQPGDDFGFKYSKLRSWGMDMKGESWQRCSQHAEALSLHRVPNERCKGALHSLMILWHASPTQAVADSPHQDVNAQLLWSLPSLWSGVGEGLRPSPRFPCSQASGTFRPSC